VHELGVKGCNNGGKSPCGNQKSQEWEQESTKESKVLRMWVGVCTGIEGLKNPCENRRSWESMQKLKISGMQKSMGKSRRGESRVGQESKI